VSSPADTRPNKPAKHDRRYPRVATPQGVWVAWQDGDEQSKRNVSRVRDLNIGGLYIATLTPAELGTSLTLLMAVPEGEIRAKANVRNVVPGEGMGVQFTELGQEASVRLQSLISRLIHNAPSDH
jgi:PilZ domain-containing protein